MCGVLDTYVRQQGQLTDNKWDFHEQLRAFGAKGTVLDVSLRVQLEIREPNDFVIHKGMNATAPIYEKEFRKSFCLALCPTDYTRIGIRRSTYM
jgi:hypothetical protein